jgi:hypothetical protein
VPEGDVRQLRACVLDGLPAVRQVPDQADRLVLAVVGGVLQAAGDLGDEAEDGAVGVGEAVVFVGPGDAVLGEGADDRGVVAELLERVQFGVPVLVLKALDEVAEDLLFLLVGGAGLDEGAGHGVEDRVSGAAISHGQFSLVSLAKVIGVCGTTSWPRAWRMASRAASVP